MNGGPSTRSQSNSSSSETSSTDHTVDPIVEDVGVDRQADDLVDDVDNADLLANLVNFEGFDDLDLRDPRDRLDSLTASIRARMGSQDDQDLANSYRLEIDRIKDDFDDEFSTLVFTDIPMSLRNKYIQQLDRDKDAVRKIVTFFKQHPELAANENEIESFKELKKELISISRVAWEAVKGSEFTWDNRSVDTVVNRPLSRAPSRTTPSEVRAERLQSQFDAYYTLYEGTCVELTELGQITVSTKAEMRNWTTKWEQIKSDLEELESFFSTISQSAVDLDSGALSDKCVDVLKGIKTKVRDGRKAQTRHLNKLEISNASGTERGRVQVKIPTFSGKFEELDYYTFKKRYDDYIEMSDLSLKERSLLLKNNILSGEAALACSELEDEDKILAQLKLLYGKSQLLFSARCSDITKTGRCPSDPLKARTWVITILQKLVALNKLAKDHKLVAQLQQSRLIDHIYDLFTSEQKKAFRELCEAALPVDHQLTKEFTNQQLESFLRKQITKGSFDVDFDFVIGKIDDKEGSTPKHDGKGKTHPKGKSGTFHTGEGASLSGAGPCTTSSSPSPSKAKKKSKPKSSPVSTSDNFTISTSDKPLVRDCKVCDKKHDFLYFCRVFQRASCKDRYTFCCRTGACPRCLRMDSGFKWKKSERDAWFSKHKHVCNLDWLCTEDKCSEVKDESKTHFLLCRFHIDKGRERVESFIEAIDSKFLPPSVRFYNNKPVNENDTGESVSVASHLSFSNDFDDFNVEDFSPEIKNVLSGKVPLEPAEFLDQFLDDDEHVSDPPMYMVHYLPSPTGAPLLMFYDSGCYGACLSSRAYGLLETHCVRRGPTVMQVAGAQTVQLPNGDELFRLPLSSGRTAPIIGLHMEQVSHVFPTWPLAEAWHDLQTSFVYHHPGKTLPAVAERVGGQNVDIMLGIRYLKYLPTFVHGLPSGLEIRLSKFEAYEGKPGVLAGPHSSWKQATEVSNLISPAAYLSYEMAAFNSVNSPLLKALSHGEIIHEPADADFLLPSLGVEVDDYVGDLPVVPQCLQQVSQGLRDFREWEVDHIFLIFPQFGLLILLFWWFCLVFWWLASGV